MLGGGLPVFAVAAALGDDPAVTMRVCAHVTPNLRRETAQAMDDILGSR